ncbi:uncharacterized protein ARMOST_13576 [Armillaria ostoyae]|uniref:Uncharacterized protein n=1 Tax=Armillaria ostoyae TaxID=47428 RepID=A0A284RN38_ARMOS|nr:uncharacterized protein ARMOST_13576 [Armillaria ostoyae]
MLRIGSSRRYQDDMNGTTTSGQRVGATGAEMVGIVDARPTPLQNALTWNISINVALDSSSSVDAPSSSEAYVGIEMTGGD